MLKVLFNDQCNQGKKKNSVPKFRFEGMILRFYFNTWTQKEAIRYQGSIHLP